MGRVELTGTGTTATVYLYGDNLMELALDEKNNMALNGQNDQYGG